MKKYRFCLTGLTPLLVHADDIIAADSLIEWRRDPMNKNRTTPGDDRSPAWTWKTYLYSDGKHLTVPFQNLMASLRLAGAEVSMSGRKTFKVATQTGLVIEEEHLKLIGPKGFIDIKQIDAISDEASFAEHRQAVKPLGFELYVIRAKIGNAKHVRVRPRFDEWRLEGHINVTGPEFTLEKLRSIFDIAGMHKGLLDWRPSSPKSPGPFGRFKNELTPIESSKQTA